MTLTKHGSLRSFVTTGPLRATLLFTTTFKLYEHSTNITLKHVIKKKGKESGDEELVMSEDQADVDLNESGNVLLEVQFPADHQGLIASRTSTSEDTSQLLLATTAYKALAKSWSLKISGRYPHLGMGESSPYNTTVLLPETGPWKQGTSELIVGPAHAVIDKFYRVLEQAKEAASKRHHVLDEEKWIIEGFALCILPINEYHGPLCPLLDNFLKSLQESLNVILKAFLQTWTSEEVVMKLNDLNDTILEEMYNDYLLCPIAKWQINFKRIIKDLVHCMPDTMCLKAEDKRRQWVMGRRKHEESDAAGVCDPKVMSLSTSGLVQGSDSGSMFAHEK
ncbi:hypothetical protein C8Q72DRAFT_797172 [Fomitopsis betulina]|nr:hypothetical protein C8Q72DRAFT_797172 [Fomitopsis betulina]